MSTHASGSRQLHCELRGMGRYGHGWILFACVWTSCLCGTWALFDEPGKEPTSASSEGGSMTKLTGHLRKRAALVDSKSVFSTGCQGTPACPAPSVSVFGGRCEAGWEFIVVVFEISGIIP